MSTPAMRTRPSPHTRRTSGDAASSATAAPGTTAEKPPTIESSCVTRPCSDRTSRSASSVPGVVSRTMTGMCDPGCRAAIEESPGSTFAGRLAAAALGSIKLVPASVTTSTTANRSATGKRVPGTSRTHPLVNRLSRRIPFDGYRTSGEAQHRPDGSSHRRGGGYRSGPEDLEPTAGPACRPPSIPRVGAMSAAMTTIAAHAAPSA